MSLNFIHIRKYRYHRSIPALFIMVLSIYLSSCSSTNQYKFLSFFFDGVPNPDVQAAIQKRDSISRKDSTSLAENLNIDTSPKGSIHSPYQEKECATCHDQSAMGKFTELQPKLCYQCHEDFSSRYKVLHGPVGGGHCTACHNPHLSENVSLLKRTNQSLCLFCHEQKQVLALEPHQDIESTSCTECHNPHGGDDKYILR